VLNELEIKAQVNGGQTNGLGNNPENLNFQLPDPQDKQISELEFENQVDTVWQVCDRFDLQTDIWRGRILRAVRDREKFGNSEQSTGFLNWLNDREISKNQAYAWIALADSADTLLENGHLDADSVDRFSKRAFIATAQAAPEVQELIGEAARNGEQITRREVRQLTDEWTAMTSDLIPAEVKEQAATSAIPIRYLAPLVREMAKLPDFHQTALQESIRETPDVDTVKQVTAEAKNLARYLTNTTQVQALSRSSVNLEAALEEAVRIGCSKSIADLVNQASQMEQMISKLYATWKRLNGLTERLYVDSGASTPHLRSLLSSLECLSGDSVEVQLGSDESGRTIRLHITDEAHTDAAYS
jgi:hypothetical protein